MMITVTVHGRIVVRQDAMSNDMKGTENSCTASPQHVTCWNWYVCAWRRTCDSTALSLCELVHLVHLCIFELVGHRLEMV